MFCPRCGTQNEAGAANCQRCGSALPQPQSRTSDPSSSSPYAGGSGSSPADPGAYGGSPSVPDSPSYPGPPGQGYGGASPYGGPPYGSGQPDYGGSQPGYGGSPYGSPGGQPGYGGPPGAGGDVPNYMVLAIVGAALSFLSCCLVGLIPGIPAILFSTQVNQKLQVGDYAGAVSASGKAKLWSIIALALGGAGIVLNLLLFLSGALSRW